MKNYKIIPPPGGWNRRSKLKELLRDMITIVKQDGKRFENVRALVQRGKIITDQIKIPIEPGDHVIRKTRAGVEESFIVDDPGFLEGGELSHYEMKVQKTGEPVSPDPKPMIYYNVTGANTRININSVDGSTNVVNAGPEKLFAELRDAIAGIAEQDRATLLQKTDELEDSVGHNSFPSKYAEFVALAANHISILSPFIPALAQLIQSS